MTSNPVALVKSGLIVFVTLASVGCKIETVEPNKIHVFVPEQQILAIRVGMSRQEVERRLGKPVSVEKRDVEEWHYPVWRGEQNIWRFLFVGRRKVKLLSGSVYFSSNRVVRVRVFEQSSSPAPSRPMTSTQ